MGKLSLSAAPTFKAKVPIPVPGSDPALVEFTFKHRTRDAVVAWLDAARDDKDEDAVLELATAWDLDDAFTAENIARLCQNYAGAGVAIVNTYLQELRGARAKN